jgi:prolyl 4-hydroxylase
VYNIYMVSCLCKQVHYDPGQQYLPHYDWQVGRTMNTRYATLLLYLNNQSEPTNLAGGETSFPKASPPFKVHPGAGSAVLFYDILADGNVDDLALHAALPVHRGEKWLANFWVWDPKKD